MKQIRKPPILADFALSDAQLAAVLARGQDVAVTAGAGTGKTRTLVARFLILLADGLPLRNIVAVTFTRKAAREMRNRVRQEIGGALQQFRHSEVEQDRWQALYDELDAARIGTIHNLCAEILRAHPAEARIDPQFTILDETESTLLAQEAVEASLAWAVATEAVLSLFDLLSERQLLELIATLLAQRLTARDVTGQLPPGTITSQWQATLEEVQGEMIDQLLADPATISAVETLQQNRADKRDDRMEAQRRMALAALKDLAGAKLTEQLSRLAGLGRINLSGGSQKSWPGGKEQLQKVKEALKGLRSLYRDRPLLAQSLNEQDAAVAGAMPAIYQIFAYAQRSYQALKAERESLDFDDLEDLAIQLLEDHLVVRSYWQSQVQALLVDEFQDTNARQRHFLRLLAPKPGKLFVVGDAKQSIYRFRGADVAVFAQEKERIGREEGDLIDLDTSYRTHKPLLDGLNTLLRPVLGEDSADRPAWVAPFAPLNAGLAKREEDLPPPLIEFHLTLGTKEEALAHSAAALAERLIQLHLQQHLDYGQMAILCRASGSFQYYENAFDAASVPYLTVAGKGFYDRPEIRDLLNALQAIADPHDDLALTGLLRSPACGLADVALYELAQQRQKNNSLWTMLQQGIELDDRQQTRCLKAAVDLIYHLHQQAGRRRAADLLKMFLDRTAYRAIIRRAGQPRALRNVAKLLQDVHKSELVSVNAFLEYAQTLRDSGTREGEARATTGGAVQIMSIHAAKGLEFPVVVLGDAGSGTSRRDGIAVDPQLGILLPFKNEDGDQAASYQLWSALAQAQDEAETDRLLYVALTRAAQMLIINGYVSQSRSGKPNWRGWLGQLAKISNLAADDLEGYDAQGDGKRTIDLRLGETTAQATMYEPGYRPLPAEPLPSAAEETMDLADMSGLQEPLASPPDDAGEKETAEDGEEERAVWRVIPRGRRPRAPAWLIGVMVHEALALWRFPGDGFDEWVTARAKARGLNDARQLQHAQTRTRRLLDNFRGSHLFQEIEKATKRFHELPYTYEQKGQVESGRIDLLYLSAGQWTVVDFKTDQVRNEAELNKMRGEKGYDEQLQQYGTAVTQLLGQTPRLILCLLDYKGRAQTRMVLPLNGTPV